MCELKLDLSFEDNLLLDRFELYNWKDSITKSIVKLSKHLIKKWLNFPNKYGITSKLYNSITV